MDEAWAWGILSGLAIMITSSILGFAPSLIDRRPKFGWWCVAVSPIPLIAWDIAWIVMTNPPDNLRRLMSVVIGAVAGGLILFGATEALHGPAKAQQATPPHSDGTTPGTQGLINNRGIVTFGQTGDNTLNVYGPVKRQLKERQITAITNTIKGADISILITAPNDPEVRAYEQQIAQALLAGGIAVQQWNIGTMSPPPYGVQIRSNGHDTAPLVTALRAGGINPEVVDGPVLVPASVRQQYSGFIGLVIGFRQE